MFLPIDGNTFTDSGTGTVHDAPSPPPNWTAYADLRTSSNSNNNATNVLEIPEATIDAYGTGSPINPATSFTLTDLTTGTDTGGRLQIDNSSLGISSDNGGNFTGGPAFSVFGGIVDGAGVFSFTDAGAVFQLNVSGLDPTKRYTAALTNNRDQSHTGDERWTDLELMGAVASTEASGGTTTVVSPTHVRFGSWDNTARGDMGRWTDIDPGPDGAFSIQTNLYLTGDADRSYTPSQFMLTESDAAPPATHTVSGTLTPGDAGGVVWAFKASDGSYAGGRAGRG